MTIRARALMRAYHQSPAPTNRAFLKLLRGELRRNRKRLPRSLNPEFTPWQLLVYVLFTGRLGHKFDKREIAYMINPHRQDMSSAHDRVDLALARLGLKAD